MREWFKARNVWGAIISSLSDEDAGRLCKAIWAYTMTGQITQLDGAVNGIFAMILMILQQEEEHDCDVSRKRAIAGSTRRAKSDDIKSDQLITNDINCYQLPANDDNCSNKNKNKSKNKNTEQESESEYIPADDAHRIQLDHDTLLDSAENAGFKMSADVRDQLIAMYAQHGMEKVMNGLKSCVKYGVPTLAYLEAVLKGEPKKQKRVASQQYEQRDYDQEQDDAMRRMLEVMRA